MLSTSTHHHRLLRLVTHMAAHGLQSPPPPPPPISRSNVPMLYYGLIVVGTAAVVLTLYNLLVLRWCADRRGRSAASPIPLAEIAAAARTRAGGDGGAAVVVLPASFRYGKEKAAAAAGGGGDGGCECAVCLSVFEEGEEVRRLPRCRHVFHAACIDMWLFSHADCPLCRTPVVAGRRGGQGTREVVVVNSGGGVTV